MSFRLVAVLGLLFGLACGGVSVSPAQQLKPVCEGPYAPVDVVQLDLRPARVPPGVDLVVSADGLEIRGRYAPDIAAMDRELRAAATRATLVGDDQAVRLYASPDASARLVARALARAHEAGFHTAHAVVLSNEPASFPPFPDPAYAADLQGRLAGVSPERRSMTVALDLTDLLSLCPQGELALEAAASASPDMRCPLLAAGLEEALPRCVFTNGDKVVTALQVMFEPHWRHVPSSFPIALDTPLVVDEAATWAEVAPRLAAAR